MVWELFDIGLPSLQACCSVLGVVRHPTELLSGFLSRSRDMGESVQDQGCVIHPQGESGNMDSQCLPFRGSGPLLSLFNSFQSCGSAQLNTKSNPGSLLQMASNVISWEVSAYSWCAQDLKVHVAKSLPELSDTQMFPWSVLQLISKRVTSRWLSLIL